jgi:metal-sulfur cluster biosynthetic enzyme
MGGFMIDEIKTKLKRVETINLVDIQLTFDPPWSPEMLTEVGKEKLGI